MGFDTMFEGDTIVPEPLVPPPPTKDWGACISREIFDRPSPSYGTKFFFLMLLHSLKSPYLYLFHLTSPLHCLIEDPNTGEELLG